MKYKTNQTNVLNMCEGRAPSLYHKTMVINVRGRPFNYQTAPIDHGLQEIFTQNNTDLLV